VLQSQLAAIGIKLNIKMSELNVYVDTWLKGDFDMAVAQNGGRPDPYPMYNRYFTKDGNLLKVSNFVDDELDSLLKQGSSMAGSYATAYLGRAVSVTNGQASLSGGAANWTYNLGSTAQTTNLTITNASDQVVWTGKGETASGNHALAWDGKDINGNALPEGAYKLTVTAKDSASNTVTSAVASAGVVSQIDMSGGAPLLVIGKMEVGFADVAAVAN